MDSIEAFGAAVEAFAERLAEVDPYLLGLALCFHLANMALRSRAWLSILRAAYPRAEIAYRSALAAYAAGVGVNAILPARSGDIVKIVGARTRIERSTTPTILATLVAETVLDAVVAGGLLTWAYASGNLPGVPSLPTSGLFEWSFVRRNLTTFEILAALAPIVAYIGWRYAAAHVRRLRAHVARGLVILRSPRAYLVGVALPQGAGWLCRLATAWTMLAAFGVEANATNAALVLVVGSVSTALPVTPGGAGAQQALLALVLAGAASQSTILAFSVGAQVATTATNAIVGLIALLALFGHVNVREVIAHARSRHAADQA